MILLITYQQQWFFKQCCLLEWFQNKNEFGELKPNRPLLHGTILAWNCRIFPQIELLMTNQVAKKNSKLIHEHQIRIYFTKVINIQQENSAANISVTLDRQNRTLARRKSVPCPDENQQFHQKRTISGRRLYSRLSLIWYSETLSQRITYFFQLMTTNKKSKQLDIVSEVKNLLQKTKN